MNELEVTWGKATKIWWSMAWRGVLVGLLGGFIAGLFIGFIGAALGISEQTISALATLSGLVVGIPIGIWVVKYVLGKKFGDFRIVLVELE